MFSANSSQVSEDRLYVEDVFSTWLYTGTGSTQTITNGIDLAGKGGLVWFKARGNSLFSHQLYDTARGATIQIATNSTSGNSTNATGLTAFTSSGFTIGSLSGVNSGDMASWTFREAPKFFDVVTYTGTGSARTISHSLGVAPGFIIIKRTDSAQNWFVWHRFNGSSPITGGALNLTNAISDTSSMAGFTATTFNPDLITDTTFLNTPNVNGATYVAYLFAHDAASDGIIQCGSYTGNGSATGPTVTLGWEPQWLLVKDATTASYDWRLVDNMRGMPVGSGAPSLFPNLSNAEFTSSLIGFNPTATGFQVAGSHGSINASGSTYIYIAIRRGPMRTPTSGTSVFAPVSQAGGGTITTNFPVDLVFTAQNTLVGDKYSFDRLRGSVSTSSKYLITNKTDAEATVGAGFGLDNNVGYKDNGIFAASYNAIYWNFRRAPSFFDEVCYTGTGSARTINHNLGVVPEFMIVKGRSLSGYEWMCYHKDLGAGNYIDLSMAFAAAGFGAVWNSTTPTSTVFSVGTYAGVNQSSSTFVAYLFASCPGVSKVGSYTGNGTTQTIDCGFASGARFVLIKRTDSTGDWYVFDTARGMTTLNDPYLRLNSTAAETSTLGAVTTTSVGFSVNASILAAINTSGASYIFLAIA